MKFKEFLFEQEEKHAVLSFGRFSPPTIGHEKLVNKVQEIAKKVNGTAHVVLSHSHDPKKNPLSAAQKLKHAKRAFPGVNVSASDKEHPNFLSQAAKLHKQGVTHLHMVGGQDRVDEYHKILHKYNGVEGPHGHFKFKHIEVHSAGDRDPDAEGVEGMSASKMREHAAKGKFKEFKKGVPSKMTDTHAKDMYNDVRKGMGLKEELDIDNEFENLLIEGVHDKSIFKAVFLAGGPGSGKDYVLDNTLQGHGLVEINSDKALEFLMDKHGLDKTMPATERHRRDLVRGKAKNMTELRQRLALMGRNGLIINGTGDDVEKISTIKKKLEELGYESSMVMVNTDNEVSKQRNIERGQRGGRTVPEEIRQQKWNDSQNARAKYAEMFKDNYKEFDNSEDLRTASPEVVKAKKQELNDIFKHVQKFTSTAPKNDTSKNWVAAELDRKDLLKVDKEKIVKNPHESSKAAEQAKKLGLQYFGFGRYGTNGKVTHRSVHDRLTEVPKEPKKVNEEFESILSESFDFSDSGAMNLLLLGTGIQEFEFEKFEEEKKPKYLTDKLGKIRTFMLRSAAAREAHTINGTVMPHKNGYVVKLKEENQNVELDQKLVFETSGEKPSIGSSNSESARETCGLITEQTTSGKSGLSQEATTEKRKITLQEIYAKQKEKVKESIDKGIEPGISMAAAGENGSRDMGEKINKKGKATPVVDKINELTGDETTMSIGDQKELELKRKGINLQTFKAKKFVG